MWAGVLYGSFRDAIHDAGQKQQQQQQQQLHVTIAR